MRHVRLLATGGTIASTSGAAGRLARVGASELLATAGPLPDDVRISTREITTLGSFALDTADLLAIARDVREALDEGADGVVVTHGTDVMEESSFLADLVHTDPRPVVFTGAQRPFDDPAPDGPANLTDAVRVAADPASRGMGVLIVFDGVALPARGAAKTDTMATHAFTAPGRGPALRILAGSVQPLAVPRRGKPFRFDPQAQALPRVDVVSLYAGTDAALLRASVGAGAPGVVLAAFGAGNANPAIVSEVERVTAAGMSVLVCSRVPAGPVTPLYSGGGGADLARAGALFGSDLSPWQGRLLLATALAQAAYDPAAGSPARLIEKWLSPTNQGGGEDG